MVRPFPECEGRAGGSGLLSVWARALLLLSVLSAPLVGQPYEALVVKGRHLNGRSSDSVKDILESHLGLSVGTVRLEDLASADFTGVRVLYMPGMTYLKVAPPEGAGANLRRAVAKGMGYIGTCGGSIIASELSGNASREQYGEWPTFGLFPGLQTFDSERGMRPYHFEMKHPIVARSSVAAEITPVFEIEVNGGPGNYIPNEDSLPGLVHWVVAWHSEYQTQEKSPRPAVTATLLGKGRVFLSSPHPERSYIPKTHCVIKMAAEWCVGRLDPAENQPPTVVDTVPEAGRVGEGLVFSAAGSDDPEGFPIGFTWDFGDGSRRVYTPRATHSFSAKGTHTVTLTVTDGKDETVRTRRVTVGTPGDVVLLPDRR